MFLVVVVVVVVVVVATLGNFPNLATYGMLFIP